MVIRVGKIQEKPSGGWQPPPLVRPRVNTYNNLPPLNHVGGMSLIVRPRVNRDTWTLRTVSFFSPQIKCSGIFSKINTLNTDTG